MKPYNRYLGATILRGMLELQCYGIGEYSMVKISVLQKVYFILPQSGVRVNLPTVFPGPYDVVAAYTVIDDYKQSDGQYYWEIDDVGKKFISRIVLWEM